MGYWNSRGLRGQAFEELINFSNQIFMQRGLAVIQKVPTPITPIKIDNENSTITLAYFGEKSTVDYIGAIQGVPVCFDAKETKSKSLPMQNIHEHQVDFMSKFSAQGGAAFLLVHFLFANEYYLLPIERLNKYYDSFKNGGRKSIPYEEFKHAFPVSFESGVINYLEALNSCLIALKGGSKA